MSDWLLMRSRRMKVAELFLYLLLAVAVILFLAHAVFSLPGDYRLGLLLLPVVPTVSLISRHYGLDYAANLAAVAIVFGYVLYQIIVAPSEPLTIVLFAVAPMALFFLTNLHIGSLLSLLLMSIYIAVFAITPYGDGAVGLSLFSEGLAASVVVAVLAWLYEHDWLAIEARLLLNSEIDFLTQVYNRRGLNRMLQKAMADALRYRQEMAVMLFQVEGMEQVYKGQGQQAGDEMLIELAELIGRHIRAGDSVGRWDQERFMVLAPNTDLAGARQFAEKLQRLLKSYYLEGVGHVDASFGVVRLEHDSLHGLLEKVEEALQEARESGRSVHVNES